MNVCSFYAYFCHCTQKNAYIANKKMQYLSL